MVAPTVKPAAGVIVEELNVVPPIERVLVTDERLRTVPPWDKVTIPIGEIVNKLVADEEAASKRLAVWVPAPSNLKVVVPAEVDWTRSFAAEEVAPIPTWSVDTVNLTNSPSSVNPALPVPAPIQLVQAPAS